LQPLPTIDIDQQRLWRLLEQILQGGRVDDVRPLKLSRGRAAVQADGKPVLK
jgi:hypothetical protein